MRHSRAIVLPSLLMVTVVLVVLAGALVSSGTSSLRLATRDHVSNQALYAAESGLSVAVEEYGRLLKLEGERTGRLAGTGATFRVVVLKNEDIAPQRVHHELLSPEGLVLPAGTMYLLSVGQAENGSTRRAGALFRIGLEAIEVGVLSDRLVAKNSEFKAYNSTESIDPVGVGKTDSGLLASHRVDPADTTPEFDFGNSHVHGAVYVAPHSTPEKGIFKDETSTVAREGILGGPIALEDIIVPDLLGGGTSTDSETGETGETGGRLRSQDAGGGSFTLGDLLVKWSGHPVKVDFYERDHDEEDEHLGQLNLNQLQKQIDKSLRDNVRVELVSEDDETVYWTPDGKFLLSDDGTPSVSVGPSGELLELLRLSSAVTDLEDPETLAGGKEYGTVKITDSTPTLLENGVIVVKNLEISNGGKLELPQDGKTTIYVTGRLTIEGEDALFNSSKLPPNLKVFYTGDDAVKLSGGSHSYFTLISPRANISLLGEQSAARTQFYGALVGRSVTIENADFFYDIATKGIGTGAQGLSLRLLNRHRL